MTKKYSYFKSELTDLFVINDELHKETFSGIDDEYNCSRIVRKLNTLTDENEELKQFKENVLVLLEEKVKDYEHKSVSIPAMQPLSFDIDMDKSLSVEELQRVIEQGVEKGYKKRNGG